MNTIPDWVARLNLEIAHTVQLPFGYRATFYYPPGDVYWEPDSPRIRQPRASRKFFDAYIACSIRKIRLTMRWSWAAVRVLGRIRCLSRSSPP